MGEELEGDIDIGGDNVSSDWSDEPFVEEGTINLSKEDHENVKNVDNSTFGSISLSKESNTCSDDIDFSKNETQGISLEKEDDSSKGGISLDKDTSTPGISLEKDENKSSGISLSKEEDTSEKKEISLEKKEEQLEKEEVKKEKAEISNASLRRSQNPAKPLLGESIDRSSSLRERLRAKKTNKKDFVPINLETMSAIAVADIKRFSLSSTAIVDIEVVKAKNLHPIKNTPPSPMCLLAIRKDTNKDHLKKIEIKKQHETTSVMPKNSSPAWNERKELHLDQVKGDSLRFLVLEIRDKSPKGEFLGYIEVNLNNIADLVQREEWFTLQKRKKKDKVTGEILLRTKIRPERTVEKAVAIRGENFPTIPSFIYNSFWNQHCVRQLSITNCGITSIPEGISALGSLDMLQLSDNCIVTIPKTLGRIFTLKCLDLSGNRISKLPNELSNLKNLQTFNISNNKFADDYVPPCAVDLDLWCDIIGKPVTWDQLIEEELHKRENNEGSTDQDDFVMNEKEKEIQRLLESMGNK